MQADTKFEVGLDEETDEIYLVDEVLTCVSPYCNTSLPALSQGHYGSLPLGYGPSFLRFPENTDIGILRPDSSRFWSKADYQGMCFYAPSSG